MKETFGVTFTKQIREILRMDIADFVDQLVV